jgi:DNA uptake protein ComE-like DNA-binding protein
MKYKLHTAYVNFHGTVVPAGVHDEKDIDLAEARRKSIVTLADIEIPTKKVPEVDKVVEKKFSATPDNSFDITEKVLEPVTETVVKESLKINSATLEEIAALKYIGKITANKVVAERAKERFTTEMELDKRVPLKGGRHWQDIFDIDFETVVPYSNDNAIKYL